MSSLAWDGFCQYLLKCILCADILGIWSKQVEICFMSLLSWDVFVSTQFEIHFVSSQASVELYQHKLSYILCPLWHWRGLVIEIQFVSSSVYTSGNTFCVIAGVIVVWSSCVEIHFLSSMAFKGFVQHMLKHILCPHWEWRCFVNTC